jgi:hypothetical protein
LHIKVATPAENDGKDSKKGKKDKASDKAKAKVASPAIRPLGPVVAATLLSCAKSALAASTVSNSSDSCGGNLSVSDECSSLKHVSFEKHDADGLDVVTFPVRTSLVKYNHKPRVYNQTRSIDGVPPAPKQDTRWAILKAKQLTRAAQRLVAAAATRLIGPQAWITDTGAADDIVGEKDIDPSLDDLRETLTVPIPLNTANGSTCVEQQCPM